MAGEFFAALTKLRQGETLPPDVVQRARRHCQGGYTVATIDELYRWMLEQNPEMPFFDAGISVGKYPATLAAFVTHCSWNAWEKHAVYALHGEIYLLRLKSSKPLMSSEQYRDHFAGASMHRANGFAHMARCAKEVGLTELFIPAWDGPRPLADISSQAVADLRTSCTLRSEKYGQKGVTENTVKAFQAALRNLAAALEIHAVIAAEGGGDAKKMSSWLIQRATNLALTDQKLLVACAAGDQLSAAEEKTVTRDLRLAETAARALPSPEQPEPFSALCARCGTASATHIGFSCRCLCMCADCAVATSGGGRIQECPVCNDFTEFVAKP